MILVFAIRICSLQQENHDAVIIGYSARSSLTITALPLNVTLTTDQCPALLLSERAPRQTLSLHVHMYVENI